MVNDPTIKAYGSGFSAGVALHLQFTEYEVVLEHKQRRNFLTLSATEDYVSQLSSKR